MIDIKKLYYNNTVIIYIYMIHIKYIIIYNSLIHIYDILYDIQIK